MTDDRFKKDIERADPVERKAITQVWNLSKCKIDDILWEDDSNVPAERRKRDFRLVMEGGMVVPFEVKADFGSAESGNIVVEYECHGRPSGLAATGSAVWVHMVPFHSGWRMYFARVSDLRERLMVVGSLGALVPNEKVVGMWPWSAYRRVTSNARSGDSNPSWNMLLHLDTHVRGKEWWMDAEMMRPCSVDWRIYGAG